jgi:hypothetical protein
MAARSLDGVLIKKAHKKMAYTQQQIDEFTKCADPKTGARYFLENFFYIQHPTRGGIKYDPYEYQGRLIDTYHNYRYSISMMPRQTGKSTSAAGYLLWFAMFVPDSTVLVAAHKYAGAQEIMQRVRYAYESCPDHIRAGVVSYNKGSLEFDNGSRIVAQTTTENTGRGMSISMLYCDEFAFVRPTIAREFWTSISPTLATGGKAIITSTPNSDEDQFALLWKGANKCEDASGNQTEVGVNGFKAYRSYWKEHPDRDEKWAEEERGKLGDERFRREMDCEFIINDETLIAPIHLLDMKGIEPVNKTGQVRWYNEIVADHIYTVGWDPSLGTGGDYSAMEIFDATSMTQIAEWKHNKTTIPEQVRVFSDIIKHLRDKDVDQNNIYFSVENNTIGEAALISIADFGEENIQGLFLSEDKKAGQGRRFRKGFNTTNKSKIAACSKLKTVIETGRLKIKSIPLISELKNFVASGTSYAAKPGEHDDLVMATVLVVRMMQQIQQYHKDLGENMTDHTDVDVEPMPFIMF